MVDVAVNIRKDSPRFGKYVMVELLAEELRLLRIPLDFAHGFQALEDRLVLHLVTKE